MCVCVYPAVQDVYTCRFPISPVPSPFLLLLLLAHCQKHFSFPFVHVLFALFSLIVAFAIGIVVVVDLMNLSKVPTKSHFRSGM